MFAVVVVLRKSDAVGGAVMTVATEVRDPVEASAEIVYVGVKTCW